MTPATWLFMPRNDFGSGSFFVWLVFLLFVVLFGSEYPVNFYTYNDGFSLMVIHYNNAFSILWCKRIKLFELKKSVPFGTSFFSRSLFLYYCSCVLLVCIAVFLPAWMLLAGVFSPSVDTALGIALCGGMFIVRFC